MSRQAPPGHEGTIGDLLRAAEDSLAESGVASPRLDAEILMAWACESDRAALVAGSDRSPSSQQVKRFSSAVARRASREPVAYIVGAKGFRHIELACDRRALIPRPETELLVETALTLAASWGHPDGTGLSVLDVGTGSGAVALAVCDELPGASVTATDLSVEALSLATENCARLDLADRIRLEPGSVPSGGSFDLVLANLPYVADGDWDSLEPELRLFEPRGALTAGEDGLDEIRRLLSDPDGINCLADRPRGIALEVGLGQAVSVEAMLREREFGRVDVISDLAGLERVVVAEISE